MKKLIFLSITMVLGLIAVPQSSHACACCGTYQVTNVASWDSLNIRTGPGTGYGIRSSIPSGSACVIKTGQCEGKWCKINYADTTGWVNSNYLKWLP